MIHIYYICIYKYNICFYITYILNKNHAKKKTEKSGKTVGQKEMKTISIILYIWKQIPKLYCKHILTRTYSEIKINILKC